MSTRTDQVRQHFDALAGELGQWRRRNRFYHDDRARYLAYVVGEGKRILEIGCGNGELLDSLRPALGVGIDLSPATVALAKENYPELQFLVADADALEGLPEETFDYIILSDLVGYLGDIQICLERLHRYCTPQTRIVVSYHNFLWQPLLKLGERLRFKMPTPEQSWLSLDDLRGLLALADFQVVKTDRRLLFPKYIPALSTLLNHLGGLPGFNRACLCHYVVARPVARAPSRDLSVSIVIPCRNERGNIEAAINRMPTLSGDQEIIFVDGHSSDDTVDEINRVIDLHPDKDIKVLMQDGIGKGDAVRKGFRAAKGDVLMILDADLTVPPEDLPKFYRAIAANKGEFLNGSRLVYPLEGEAMRALNLLGNKFFAVAFSWLLGQRFKDTLCGTKVMRRRDYLLIDGARSYFGDLDPFGDFDLLFGASKLNLKMVEIPIRYRRRTYGVTQIRRFYHGWMLLRMVIYAYRKLKSA